MTMLRETLPEPAIGPGRHTFAVNCGRCGKRVNMTVQNDDFRRWKGGMNVQVAFPYLSPKFKELLSTGVCTECTDAQFASEDEDQNR